MRPTPFFIEIPDRPVYQPGSGPAMAPIALQPDDSDTGWVIAGTVEFQGISQYVVTPVDNPAHRRPVKKQHILDWVSPKAYEDFEYAQYKKQTEAELERERQIQAKAAALKKRRHGMGVARERAKARKPFAKYMQLEPVEDGDRGNTNANLSSPEHSLDESNTEVLTRRAESVKRKHSVGSLHSKEQAVKRQGLSSSSKSSLVLKPWKPTPVKLSQHRQDETTKDDNDTEDESEAAPELKRPDTFNQPILLPPTRFTTPPRASVPQRSFVSPYSAPALFIPATASPSLPSPKSHWSVRGPPIPVNANIPKSASPHDHSKATSLRRVTPVQPPTNGKTYPPILPPSRLSRPPGSKPVSANPLVTLNRKGESLDGGKSKRKRRSLSPTDENITAEEGSETRSRSNSGRPEPPNEKTIMDRSHFSDIATRRRRWGSNNDKAPKKKKNPGSRSNSSGSSNVLRWPNQLKRPKLSNEQSKYFASMKTKQNGEEDTEDDVEGDSEEAWEIHGILDDEMRRVNGQLVRYYLCEWVGEYDPTWEPEENISVDALKRYERDKKRDSLGFDGAADNETMSENAQTSILKTLRRLEDIVGPEIKESDSEAFTDALTDAAMSLTPDENMRSRSGAGSTAGEAIIVGAELL
jgi:hypothetical protein